MDYSANKEEYFQNPILITYLTSRLNLNYKMIIIKAQSLVCMRKISVSVEDCFFKMPNAARNC